MSIQPVSGATGWDDGTDRTPVRRSSARPPRSRRTTDWAEVLDRLEDDVLAAEDSMARGRAAEIATWGRRTSDWVAPADLGPVPDDLRERAATLLQHQLAVAEALVERITQSQRQRDLAARMSYAPTRPVASFIDRAL